jgi:tetratricopeptide (TPR) repeat protein
MLPSPGSTNAHLSINNWIHGFYQPTDYASIDQLHQRMFSFQMKSACQWKRNPESAVIFFNSANLKYEKGDISGALADFDRAIRLQPGYSKAYNNRGILRATALKDYPGAITDFDKAIEFNPRYGDAFLGRGTVYFLMHNVQAACNDWSTARSLGNVKAVGLIELHCTHQ